MKPPPTLVDCLARAATFADAGVRFVDRREQESWLPWSECHARALRAAGALQGLGIEPGDRVGLVYPTGPGFLDAFFGLLLAGAVPMPLYPPARLGRLDEYHRRTGRMLAAVRARLVLADRRLRAILGETMAIGRPPLGCRELESLPSLAARPAPGGPEDLALVQFSSGTTVDPKPVALTHRSVVTQAVLLNGFWPDGPDLRHSGVSWLPLYHDMGLIGCVMTALERPGTVTLLPPEAFAARPAIWLRTISRYRATISPAPSFAYGMAVTRIRDEELDGVDLSCWRIALNGAEMVVPSVVRKFAERFARWGFSPAAMTPVYGMSEAALAVTFHDVSRPPEIRRFDRASLAAAGRAVESDAGVEIVSLGRCLPGFSVRIVDERGADLPEGNVGVIRIQGPTLMQGYLDQPELTRCTMPDGWLDSGDRGFLRAGDLYLTGRVKDVLVLRGRNHSPEEVEQAAASVSGARPEAAVAVSYLPDGADGEALLLFVEALREVSRETYPGIADACRAAVVASTGLVPDRVVVVEPGTLPRTSSGKLRRGEALALYLAGDLHPPDPVDKEGLLDAMARSRTAFPQDH